jgi:hypothetical protein
VFLASSVAVCSAWRSRWFSCSKFALRLNSPVALRFERDSVTNGCDEDAVNEKIVHMFAAYCRTVVADDGLCSKTQPGSAPAFLGSSAIVSLVTELWSPINVPRDRLAALVFRSRTPIEIEMRSLAGKEAIGIAAFLTWCVHQVCPGRRRESSVSAGPLEIGTKRCAGIIINLSSGLWPSRLCFNGGFEASGSSSDGGRGYAPIQLLGMSAGRL